MAKMNQKQFRKMGIAWFKKQGWKEQDTMLDYIVSQNHLEEEPYQPHALFQKESYEFLVNFFDKEDYFYSKTKQIYFTGMDYWKYVYLKDFETMLNIPAAVVFYNEQLDEFIFRQLNELPNPIIWRREKEFLNDYQLCLKLDQTTKEYRDCKRHALKRYKRNRGKLTMMAVWNAKEFIDSTAFQIPLFKRSALKIK